MNMKELFTGRKTTSPFRCLVILLLCLSVQTSKAQITINATNFPDANFRNYLLSTSYGKDGVITDAEIKEVTKISVVDKSIVSLKGIEYFAALDTLWCNYNQLTSLDLSKNIALTHLGCGYNQLRSLDVSKSTALTYLSCENNQLASLDVSKNTALIYLRCNDNQLTSLDVSKNTALVTLDCSVNQLTSLDLSKNTKLRNLNIYSNKIKGTMMNNLINGLCKFHDMEPVLYEYGYFIGISNHPNEGNVITKAQVAALRAKKWKTIYVNYSFYESYWTFNYVEYEGNDDNNYNNDNYIIIPTVINGFIYSSYESATPGQTVTVTVRPNIGYILDLLIIKDGYGNIVNYVRNGDTVTFVMPDSPVTITVTFIESALSIWTMAPGYVTFYDSKWAYMLPPGLQAWVVIGVSNGRLICQTLSGNIIPRGVAVLLVADPRQAASYTLTRIESTVTYNGINLIRGSDFETMTIGDGYHYTLSYGKNGFGWYWGEPSGGSFLVGANLAWLVVPIYEGVPFFPIENEEEGIEDVTLEAAGSNRCYDLLGRGVSNPAKKGVYIVNGKKIVGK